LQTSLYQHCQFKCSIPQAEAESSEYEACTFTVDQFSIKYRSAKITPTKVGQFVTLWKRNSKGITAPHDQTDPFDFYIIGVKTPKDSGQFIFPKAVLVQQGILSKNHRGGKRGFRLYPSWDQALNSQAKKSQNWQLTYFVSFSDPDHIKKIQQLLLTPTKQ
jgi:hypothetical protein